MVLAALATVPLAPARVRAQAKDLTVQTLLLRKAFALSQVTPKHFEDCDLESICTDLYDPCTEESKPRHMVAMLLMLGVDPRDVKAEAILAAMQRINELRAMGARDPSILGPPSETQAEAYNSAIGINSALKQGLPDLLISRYKQAGVSFSYIPEDVLAKVCQTALSKAEALVTDLPSPEPGESTTLAAANEVGQQAKREAEARLSLAFLDSELKQLQESKVAADDAQAKADLAELGLLLEFYKPKQKQDFLTKLYRIGHRVEPTDLLTLMLFNGDLKKGSKKAYLANQLGKSTGRSVSGFVGPFDQLLASMQDSEAKGELAGKLAGQDASAAGTAKGQVAEANQDDARENLAEVGQELLKLKKAAESARRSDQDKAMTELANKLPRKSMRATDTGTHVEVTLGTLAELANEDFEVQVPSLTGLEMSDEARLKAINDSLMDKVSVLDMPGPGLHSENINGSSQQFLDSIICHTKVGKREYLLVDNGTLTWHERESAPVILEFNVTEVTDEAHDFRVEGRSHSPLHFEDSVSVEIVSDAFAATVEMFGPKTESNGINSFPSSEEDAPAEEKVIRDLEDLSDSDLFNIAW